MPLIYIDDTGIHAARLDEIKAYVESVLRGIYGLDIDLSTETTDGQLVGTLSEVWSDILQVCVQIYNARSPAGATGAALARLVKINGVTKKDPAPSTGTATLTSASTTTAGVLVPAGSRLANAQPGVAATFMTTADATIPAGGGTVDVGIQSTVNGPIPGNAGDLTNIITVIPGWASVTNAADVTLGTTGETDAQLRTRRAASVALPSQGIVDGLRAAILQLSGVEQCIVRENPEDTVQTLADGGTLAPHAIQVIVKGGDHAEIAKTIWLKKSAGVTLVGAITATVTDSQGVDHDIKLDDPTPTPIYVKVNTTSALSGDVQTAVKNSIVARGQGLLKLTGVPLPGSQIGEDVSVSDIYQAIAVLSVTTVPGLKVNEIDIGTSPSPTTDTPVAIAFDHIATWDPAHITFNPP
jgi:uncharacterized phage protein gp47/JayE